MNKDEVLNLKKAAEFLQLNREVVRRNACLGKIPGRKIIGRWRFYKPQLVEFLKTGYAAPDEMLQANHNGVEERCQLAKEKTANIIIQGSRSKGLAEYTSLLAARREEMRKGMKKN